MLSKYRRTFIAWAVALATGLILGGSGVAASAATTYSSWLSFYGYAGRSILINAPTYTAQAETSHSPGVPSGYLGAQGGLYVQSSGALCKTGTWTYNNLTATSLKAGNTSGYCGSGAYYSYSVSRGWDSATSSYNTNYNNFSPALNF